MWEYLGSISCKTGEWKGKLNDKKRKLQKLSLAYAFTELYFYSFSL